MALRRLQLAIFEELGETKLFVADLDVHVMGVGHVAEIRRHALTDQLLLVDEGVAGNAYHRLRIGAGVGRLEFALNGASDFVGGS